MLKSDIFFCYFEFLTIAWADHYFVDSRKHTCFWGTIIIFTNKISFRFHFIWPIRTSHFSLPCWWTSIMTIPFCSIIRSSQKCFVFLQKAIHNKWQNVIHTFINMLCFASALQLHPLHPSQMKAHIRAVSLVYLRSGGKYRVLSDRVGSRFFVKSAHGSADWQPTRPSPHDSLCVLVLSMSSSSLQLEFIIRFGKIWDGLVCAPWKTGVRYAKMIFSKPRSRLSFTRPHCSFCRGWHNVRSSKSRTNFQYCKIGPLARKHGHL